MLLTIEESKRTADLARWAYARAALVASDMPDQRRLAWSVLVGALRGYGAGPLKDLIPDPPDAPPASLDAVMASLRTAMATAFLDGPSEGMFMGDDAEEAWDELVSRFILNATRANIVIIDRGRYDALVKNQRERPGAR